MQYNCFLCNKKLEHKVTWDIRYAFKRFPYCDFERKDFDLFDPKHNIFFCVDCGINYHKLKAQKNILKHIQNRSINGKFNLKRVKVEILDKSEYCNICNKKIEGITTDTSIHNRNRNYIEGFGSLCSNCNYLYG